MKRMTCNAPDKSIPAARDGRTAIAIAVARALRGTLQRTTLGAVLALAGCAVGPDYVKPTLDVPTAYKESGQWKTAQPMDDSPRGDWWTICQDPRLNDLMATLNQQSPTIAQAEAQYRQAQALLRQAQSSLFPTLGVTASATRSGSASGNSATATVLNGTTVSTSSSKSGVSNAFNLGLNASWEPDLWGGIRRSVEAGEATQAASAAQLAAIKLSSQVQMASAYLQLVVADQQIKQLLESEKALQDTLQLTLNQSAAGIVSDANVSLATSQLKSAQAQRVDRQLTRAQLEHAIAAALGQPPSTFSLPESEVLPHLPQVPAGLPSALLERRPDIAAAERNVAAANAQIGVVKAAFFPSLTLSASGGFRSDSFADWLTVPNRIWSLGPQLALTLFDAGLRRAQTDAAIASYDASVANYRITVLSAFQAVEDDLAAQAMLDQQAELQAAALTAARRSETITLNQYRAGIVGFIDVLAAQNSRLSAESNLWTVRTRQYINSVALIAAIGGQW